MSKRTKQSATALEGFLSLDATIQSELLRFEKVHRKSVAPEGIVRPDVWNNAHRSERSWGYLSRGDQPFDAAYYFSLKYLRSFVPLPSQWNEYRSGSYSFKHAVEIAHFDDPDRTISSHISNGALILAAFTHGLGIEKFYDTDCRIIHGLVNTDVPGYLRLQHIKIRRRK